MQRVLLYIKAMANVKKMNSCLKIYHSVFNALEKLGEFLYTGVFSEMSNLLNNTENISI